MNTLTKHKVKLLIVLGCMLNANVLYANGNFNVKGGNDFSGKVSSEYGYVNNYLFENTGGESTTYISLKPEASLQIQKERHLWMLSGLAEYSAFSEFSEDNHTNYTVTPVWHYKLRHNLSFYSKANIDETSEARGQGISYGAAKTLKSRDKKKATGVNGGVLYGGPFSRAKLFLEAGAGNNEYRTRRDISRIFDESFTTSIIGFDYLLSGKSYIASELQYKSSRYENNPAADKAQYGALLGYKWQSTTITKIEMLAGYEKVSIVEGLISDANYFKWRLNLDWSPVEAIKVHLTTQRNVESTNKVTNSYAVSDVLNAELSYDVNNMINISMGYNVGILQIIYEMDTEEESQRAGHLTLKYNRSDRFSVHMVYKSSDADNTLIENNYMRSTLILGFTANI